MKIITGSTGTAHVTSNNDGEFNQGIFGAGLVVLNNGYKLEAQIKDANTITIKDGDLVMQGRHALIEPGTTEDVTILTGAVGKKRIDLIVARYVLDESTGYENISLEVITGEETEGTPVVPAYTEGNIRTGSLIAEMPLYRVNLNGINIESVEPYFGAARSLIDEIGSKQDRLVNPLTRADIVDNGVTADNTKVLSASYGKTLRDYSYQIDSGLQAALTRVTALENSAIPLVNFEDYGAVDENTFIIYLRAWISGNVAVGKTAIITGHWNGLIFCGNATRVTNEIFFAYVNVRGGSVYALDDYSWGKL